MALMEYTLYGYIDKVQQAIRRIRTFAPQDGSPVMVAFSGGKDSQCVYHLTEMSGVPFDAVYSVTSVDPPELMRFIKNQYPQVKWERHYWNDEKPEHYFPDGNPRQITMWNLLADNVIPPTRETRYCCDRLKEPSGDGRVVVTGVRWAESVRRKQNHGVVNISTISQTLHKEAAKSEYYRKNKFGYIVFMDDNDTARRIVETCYAKVRTTINPIADWKEDDVWEFLNDYVKVPHCELYDKGLSRIGCIGCPMQSAEGMRRDFEMWPRYRELYIRAFNKMIDNHYGDVRTATGEIAEHCDGEKILERWIAWNA